MAKVFGVLKTGGMNLRLVAVASMVLLLSGVVLRAEEQPFKIAVQLMADAAPGCRCEFTDYASAS